MSLLEHGAMRDTAPLSDISKLAAEVKKRTVIPTETSSEVLFNLLNEYPQVVKEEIKINSILK